MFTFHISLSLPASKIATLFLLCSVSLLARTHPETGKKILFVNWTYTKKIIGLEQEESDEILKKIFEHQARLELTCRFSWTENTVCIWDNRSVIHFAIADFYPGRGLGYERVMDRIAIEGDHPQ